MKVYSSEYTEKNGLIGKNLIGLNSNSGKKIDESEFSG